VNKGTHPARQRGMTMISWIMVLAIIVFFVIVGIKLVPSYIEFYSIQGILEAVRQDRTMRDAPPAKIRESIKKRMKINGIYEFDPKNIVIKKEKTGQVVTVEYEVRKNVVGNVDVIMSFKDQVSL
jgi:hypothetical protein